MTIDDLIKTRKESLASTEGRMKATLRKRNNLANDLMQLRYQSEVDPAQVEKLRNEKSDLDDELDTLTAQRDTLRAEVTELEIEKRVDAEVARISSESVFVLNPELRENYTEIPKTTKGNTMSISAVRESRTYSAERAATRGEPSFIRDLYNAQMKSDPEAMARLQRHGEEMRVEAPDMVERAVTTGGVAGFVPPQYVISLFAEYLRAGRPTANICNTSVSLPPDGMTVEIPRITTGSATGVQTTQNTALANQDIDDTMLSTPVVTVGGYVDVARQALERGILVEQIILGDLAADYSSKLDSQVLNGSGSSGQHRGILNTANIASITSTDASPTLAELWPKLADAIGRIRSSRYTGPTNIVMHPNTWAWITAALGTDGRPMVGGTSAASVNVQATESGKDYAEGFRTIQDVPVVLDGNMPTNLGAGENETRILVGDFRDAWLLEDNAGSPVQLRFDDAGSANLTSRLLVYGYSAFTAGRQPSAFSVIGGTGLITPSL